mmetsp:Transcript_50458/g.96398  ORF Transcript_50458/g.96398 Transcript_50458/m.96398 type:complete len:179 (-) Transcript_50458:642-1178(-)
MGPLPSLYPFTDGTSGTSISDGGNDMFDGGNILLVKAVGHAVSARLAYRQSISLASAGSGDVTYTTYKHQAAGIFDSASDGIEVLETQGNNGADGGGTTVWGELGASSSNSNFVGAYKQVYGTSDPSINQLVVMEGSGWSVTSATSTNDGLLTVTKTTGAKAHRLYYLMWGGRTSTSV